MRRNSPQTPTKPVGAGAARPTPRPAPRAVLFALLAPRSSLCSLRSSLLFLAILALLLRPAPAPAYVEAVYPLSRVIAESTTIVVLRVESVDAQKNTITLRKVQDLKGKHPAEVVKHNIAKAGFHPREWQNVMAWAAPGKTAVMFHNGGAAEVCIDTYWYQLYAGGEYWNMSHAEPYLLRAFAGKPEKCAAAVTALLAGQETVVPAMVDGDKNAIQLRTARIQRLKANLKLQDYNLKRDFVGWGGDDLRTLLGMPGFGQYGALPRVGLGAGGVRLSDLDGDGKPDFVLAGESRAVAMQNAGNAMNEVSLPAAAGPAAGARSAEWADYNGDGRPDLLLATPVGVRLLGNTGKTAFRDDTAALPPQPGASALAAVWLDYDGDGKPDILAADGFGGLRLYRNLTAPAPKTPASPATPEPGKWYYCGPFPNEGGTKGFDTVFPPEKEINLAKTYGGKGGAKAAWKEGKFTDGQLNDLNLFEAAHNENAVVYLYRELNAPAAMDLPVSFGSDDTLTVWHNGQKVVAQNESRGAAPDQAKVTLKLQPGKNALLLKICQGTGGWQFYFAAQAPLPAAPAGPAALAFEDVSHKVGLGSGGLASGLRGDHLAVADVNGDKRPDFLFSAGRGALALNTPQGFVEAKDCGIAYTSGRIAPAFGDYDGDGLIDLFVPQRGTGKLYRNTGGGKFADVTAATGALAQPLGEATCAAWVDLYGRGRLDLVVGCLRGPNRAFRNAGKRGFVDITDDLGLFQRIFNTRGIAGADLNGDGACDLIFHNEGQESALLLGNPAKLAPPKGDQWW